MIDKVSPAFQGCFSHRTQKDKNDAIVIFKVPERKHTPVNGRLGQLSMRLQYAQERAKIYKPLGEKVLTEYKAASTKSRGRGPALSGSTIGDGELPVATVEVTQRTLPLLADRPDVVAVMPDQKISLIKPKGADYGSLSKQEAKGKLTWGLKRLDIPTLWKTSKGEGIKVAVLDTGVHAEHCALDGRVEEFIVIDPLGRAISANPMFDSGQHGTHVCGTIAGGKTSTGVSIGVAPEAKLLVAGVLMGETTLRTLLEGISWAVKHGAHIINMSLGFSYYEPLFGHVFDMLIDEFGIVPVAAIGNENHGNSSSPGNAYSTVGVGAARRKGRGHDVAFFSSGASLTLPAQNTKSWVTKPDVVAPGVQVYSCIPPQRQPGGTFEYAYMDGTSMAAPHVSGAIALLMAAKPTVKVTEIVEALKGTAEHPNGTQGRPDNRWGYGFIRPVRALKALG